MAAAGTSRPRPAAGTTKRQSEARLLLGERLRTERTKRGYTVADLATATKLSRTYIYDVEVGRRLFTLDQLDAVAVVYGILAVDLLGDVWPYGTATKPPAARRHPKTDPPPVDASA